MHRIHTIYNYFNDIILTINGCVSFAVIFREEERRGDL